MSDAKPPSDLSIDEILTTIRRIISEDEQAGTQSIDNVGGPAAVSGAAAAASSDAGIGVSRPTGGLGGKPAAGAGGGSDDVLELTEAVNEDGTTRHLAPIGGSVRRLAETPPAAARPEPQLRETPDLRLAPGQPAAASNEARLPRDMAVGAAGRTLEDIVGDVLRPLLQAWLDENLPPMVERLVQAEIARVGREAGAA